MAEWAGVKPVVEVVGYLSLIITDMLLSLLIRLPAAQVHPAPISATRSNQHKSFVLLLR